MEGKRVTIYMTEETQRIVEDYRRERAIRGEMLSRSEAIARLIKRGYEAMINDAKF